MSTSGSNESGLTIYVQEQSLEVSGLHGMPFEKVALRTMAMAMWPKSADGFPNKMQERVCRTGGQRLVDKLNLANQAVSQTP